MSAVAGICLCGLEVRQDIWRCEPHHQYWIGKRKYASVTSVIKELLPAAYDGVDPITLECARLRGIFVDTYFSEYLTDPEGVMDLDTVREMLVSQFPREGEKHADDTVTRIKRLLDWWTLKAVAVQHIVYSEADGIAGTWDVATEDLIIDLKCVSELNPNFRLQLGAYSLYDPQEFPKRDVGILHVTKDKVKLVKFDAKKCREQWKAACAWWKARRELGGG